MISLRDSGDLNVHVGRMNLLVAFAVLFALLTDSAIGETLTIPAFTAYLDPDGPGARVAFVAGFTRSGEKFTRPVIGKPPVVELP